MFSRQVLISLISQIRRHGAAILAVVIVCSAPLLASTLEDYQQRLETVAESLQQLGAIGEGSDRSTSSESKLIASIRIALPPTEKVEWTGGSVETDNAWLAKGLDAFAAEATMANRKPILDRMNERLQAVRQKVNDLKHATAGTQSKDDEKRKLAEILRREEYQKLQEQQESLFQQWKRWIGEWIAKMFPRLNLPQQEATGLGSLSMFLQVLLYILLAAGLGYLIYRILPFFSGRFGQLKKSPNSERIILGERIGVDQSAQDLFAEAELLARKGDMRLAIRKGYIALLCELNDRKIVALARHKTNRDYLRDLRSKPDLAKNVSSLTYSFERHWYGSDTSTETDWDQFRELYRSTIRGV